MRPYILVTCFIFFSSFTTLAQTDLDARAKADSLISLARGLREEFKIMDAYNALLKADSIITKHVGKADSLYVQLLHGKAGTLRFMGKFGEVGKVLSEALTLLDANTFDYRPILRGRVLNEFGVLGLSTGQLKSSEAYWLETKAIYLEHLGRLHQNYGSLLNNMAILYLFLGNSAEAESYWFELKAIHEETDDFGKDYCRLLNSLGGLYVTLGDYQKGEGYLLEAKERIENQDLVNDKVYTNSLNNLGTIYQVFGQYEKAKPFFEDAVKLTAEIMGKQNPDYAASISNLGTVLNAMEDNESALEHYREALEIRQSFFQNDYHPEVGISLRQIGRFYADLYQADSAFFYYSEAEKALRKNSTTYALNLVDIAGLYLRKKEYQNVEPLLVRSQQTLDTLVLKSHPVFGYLYNTYANLYQLEGKNEAAVENYLLSASNSREIIRRMARFSSEQELAAFIKKFEFQLYQQFSATQLSLSGQENMVGSCFDQALFYKGILLQTSNQIKRLIKNDPDVQEKYDQWQSYNRQLARELSKQVTKQKGVKELEKQANLLERTLVKELSGFKEVNEQVIWQQVQQQLTANEAVIEFVSYSLYNEGWTDSTMYAALLLKAGDTEPKFISLFEEQELLDLINRTEAVKSSSINDLYASRGGRPKKAVTKGLLQLNWSPLEKELAGIDRIYYSPAGLMHRINLGAIPLNKKEILADRYELIQLGSSRQLVLSNQAQKIEGNALLMGGIQYDLDSDLNLDNLVVETNAPSATELDFRNSERSLMDGRWAYLNWTEKEVDEIGKILKEKGIGTDIFMDSEASEETFRAYASTLKSPRILHLATHGFFFPDPALNLQDGMVNINQTSTFRMSEHPMIRSGLILAGANHVWTGNEAFQDKEDGILTAYEISQLDLSNTELVVLSACETGLGDIKGNEGVYGLQRAFKIAGARYMIMSLWQVPDQETQEFMTTFYREWLENERTIPEAFRKTQQLMRKQNGDPYAWAGFILVE